MSEALICDRCEEMFGGPPTAQVVTAQGELDVCPECYDDMLDWWGIDDGDGEPEPAKPETTVETGS